VIAVDLPVTEVTASTAPDDAFQRPAEPRKARDIIGLLTFRPVVKMLIQKISHRFHHDSSLDSPRRDGDIRAFRTNGRAAREGKHCLTEGHDHDAQ
jgi:hypothetical protein